MFSLGEPAIDDELNFQLTHLELETSKIIYKQGSGESTGHSTDSSKSFEEDDELQLIEVVNEGCKRKIKEHRKTPVLSVFSFLENVSSSKRCKIEEDVL